MSVPLKYMLEFMRSNLAVFGLEYCFSRLGQQLELPYHNEPHE